MCAALDDVVATVFCYYFLLLFPFVSSSFTTTFLANDLSSVMKLCIGFFEGNGERYSIQILSTKGWRSIKSEKLKPAMKTPVIVMGVAILKMLVKAQTQSSKVLEESL